MTALRIARYGVLALVASLVLAACGGGGTNSSSTASASGSSELSSAPASLEGGASESAASPAAEGTGLEAPQRQQNGGPAIAVASLPIGGNVDADGAQQCAHVNWLGPKPIPEGVTISLDGVGLDPAGIFRFGGSICGSGRPVCATSWTWTSSTADLECLIPVTQVVDSDRSVALVLAGTVHCATESSCRQFAAGLGDQQIHFDAERGVVATNSTSGETESSSVASEASSGESSSANGDASSDAGESTAGG